MTSIPSVLTSNHKNCIIQLRIVVVVALPPVNQINKRHEQ